VIVEQRQLGCEAPAIDALKPFVRPFLNGGSAAQLSGTTVASGNRIVMLRKHLRED
jgi:hypothetical protein